MAISEQSIKDIMMMGIEEINAKGGARPEDRADRGRSRLQLGPLRGEGEEASGSGQGSGDLRLLDLGQPEIGVAGGREEQRPSLLPGAV